MDFEVSQRYTIWLIYKRSNTPNLLYLVYIIPEQKNYILLIIKHKPSETIYISKHKILFYPHSLLSLQKET